MEKLIGIDLGGTTTKFAIINSQGDIEQKWTIATDAQNEGENIVPNIISSVNQQLEVLGLSSEEISGIGMGSPGAVNPGNGTVIGAYNLNWSKLQYVKKEMEAGTNIPFYLDNDANVAALGERWKGAGEDSANMVFVTLGTGVGGGVIVDGNLVHGNGAAGEIGHLVVNPYGYPCTCGNNGCLETVASATGIVRLAREISVDFKGESDLKKLIDDDEEFTSKAVFDLAKSGEKLANMVVDKFNFYLGLACAHIANLLNPEFIVIGGGVSAAGDIIITGVKDYFNKFAFPPIKTSTKIRLAKLGNDAGVIGAASLVLQATKGK